MTSRTMIYLETGQLEALQKRAREERVSMTELIRRIVREYLSEGHPPPASREAYRRIVGLGDSGNAGVSENHDRHLAAALVRQHGAPDS